MTVGFPIPDWQPCPPPPHTNMEGNYCRLEPLDSARHAEELYEAFSEDEIIWTYLPYGPYPSFKGFQAWVKAVNLCEDPQFYAIVSQTEQKATGIASFLRINPDDGVIEVGHINLASRLQKTTAATEAMYLMMRRAFDELGYRRYEWKCDALNSASQRAAKRLGFVPEGIFRQAAIYKNRNRDTAWFSIIDRDWPTLRDGFQAWLDPDNFDDRDHQRKKLSDLIKG